MNAQLLLAALVLAAPVPTRPPGGPTSSLPPRLVLAQNGPEGQLRLIEQTTVTVPVAYTVEAVRDGKKVTEQRTSYRTMPRARERLYALQAFRFYTPDGKKVDPKAVAERLKQRTTVVLSEPGLNVHPDYLRVFKADTLILVPEAKPAPAPAAPPPPAKPSERREPPGAP
jgi:hypothetical protein